MATVGLVSRLERRPTRKFGAAKAPPVGGELPPETSGDNGILAEGGTGGGTLAAELELVSAVWADLPDDVRRAVLAVIREAAVASLEEV